MKVTYSMLSTKLVKKIVKLAFETIFSTRRLSVYNLVRLHLTVSTKHTVLYGLSIEKVILNRFYFCYILKSLSSQSIYVQFVPGIISFKQYLKIINIFNSEILNPEIDLYGDPDDVFEVLILKKQISLGQKMKNPFLLKLITCLGN